MKAITTIGIDLAKNSFSVYGVDAKGKPVLHTYFKSQQGNSIFCQSARMPGRHGSLRLFGILGQRDRKPGPYREVLPKIRTGVIATPERKESTDVQA